MPTPPTPSVIAITANAGTGDLVEGFNVPSGAAVLVKTGGALTFQGFANSVASFDGSGNVVQAAIGTSLALSAGTLNTIQDIRTTATPQFARIGIGIAADAALPLKVAGVIASQADGTSNYHWLLTANGGNSGFRSLILMSTSQGTLASPLASVAGDLLGDVIMQGYTGTAFATRARFSAYAAESWSGTAQGTYMAVWTTISGGTSFSEKMRISGAGNLLVGTTTDAGLTGAGGLAVGSTTDATAYNAASVTLAGGLGVAKNLIVGGGNWVLSTSGTGGKVGSLAAQTGIIQVQTDAAWAYFGAVGVGYQSGLSLERAGGTLGAITATPDGSIANVRFMGYDGTAWQGASAQIRFTADGLWSGTNRGTYVQLYGTPNGSTDTISWLTWRNNSTAFADTGDATAYNAASVTFAGGAGFAKKIMTNSSIQTGAPTGGTAAAWKFGVYHATAPAATGWIELDVGGTLYKLLAST